MNLAELSHYVKFNGKYLGITNETTITSLYADGTKFEEVLKDE